MKGFFRENKILLAIILVIVIVAGTVTGTRIGIESENKNYDIVIDYAELEAMAEQSEYDIDWWLGYFKDMGITKIGLQEENVMTLMEDSDIPVTGDVMANVMKDALWEDDYPAPFVNAMKRKGIDRFDVVIVTGNREATEFTDNALRTRFDSSRFVSRITDDGREGYFWIDGNAASTLYGEKYKLTNSKGGGFTERTDIEGSKIFYISLGLDPKKVETIHAAGAEVIPRTLAYNGWNGEQYGKAVLDDYSYYGIVPEYIICGGEAVIGYDDGIDLAKDYILDNGVTIGLIENTTQRQNIMQYGVEEVASASGYDTVRVFSVWNYIQYRYQYYGYAGAEEIENTLFRAVTERNVRVIYFKPFKEYKDNYTYVTNPDEYAEMFANLESRLAAHGFTFGTASVMRNYSVDNLIRILIGIGAALGAVVLLRSLLPIKGKGCAVLSVLGAIAVLSAYFVMPNTAILVTSFAAAVVFACLAVTYYTYAARHTAEKLGADAKLGRIMLSACVTLAVSVVIALAGGIMTSSPLTTTSFMLEIELFRGVKLAQLLPIAYFIIVFLAFFGYNRNKEKSHLEWNDIKDLFNLKISVWMILAVAVIGAVGYYYIARTGHDTAVEVSSIEMLFRNKLEEVLIARPRTKEFMFAFPAVMLTVYAACRKLKLWTLLFGACGVIGMTSVVNTFMHMRTPLYLGFARTGYSLVFGLVLGLAAIIIFELLYRIYSKYIRKYV